MHRRRTWVLLSLLGVLAAALVAAGCGSGPQTAQSVLRETFGGANRDAHVTSGRVTLVLDSNLAGVSSSSGSDSIRLSGPFESGGNGQPPKFDFTLSRSTGGQNVMAGIVSTGTQGFVRFGGKAYSLSGALYQRLRQITGSKNGGSIAPNLSALGIDPQRWLVNPRIVGDAQIGGTETIHVSAAVNVPRFLEDASRLLSRANSVTQGQAGASLQLTPQQRQAIEKAVRSAHIDVYTGKDDKLLRKLDLRVVVGSSAGSRGGSLHFALELDDLNGDQTINAPANAVPLQTLINQMQSAAGASGSGSGSGSGGTGGAAAPAQPQQPQAQAPSTGASGQGAYLQCVQQAGGDLAKQQACAKYL